MTGCHLIDRKFPCEDACNCCCQNSAWNESLPNFSFTAAVCDLIIIDTKSLWISLSIFILLFWRIREIPLRKASNDFAHNFVQTLHSLVSLRSGQKAVIDVTGRTYWIKVFLVLPLFCVIKFPLKCIASKSCTAVAPVTGRIKQVFGIGWDSRLKRSSLKHGSGMDTDNSCGDCLAAYFLLNQFFGAVNRNFSYHVQTC